MLATVALLTGLPGHDDTEKLRLLSPNDGRDQLADAQQLARAILSPEWHGKQEVKEETQRAQQAQQLEKELQHETQGARQQLEQQQQQQQQQQQGQQQQQRGATGGSAGGRGGAGSSSSEAMSGAEEPDAYARRSFIPREAAPPRQSL